MRAACTAGSREFCRQTSEHRGQHGRGEVGHRQLPDARGTRTHRERREDDRRKGAGRCRRTGQTLPVMFAVNTCPWASTLTVSTRPETKVRQGVLE